ncbi:hypothetical protein [Streptomyces antimicrobicus]|uniref:Uncharacterized protein n=1 Tax=Streptomyces antimicrobicus TaxID=2883108 RepID=A0ABS8BB48_9ACTN|nr:hypothetical protein [Streptomyces antimicrobicus]MCB5181749.1 hypothetical protein [Streptomyces antimicrobicus]
MSEQQPNPYAGGPAQGGPDGPKWGPQGPGYGYPQPGYGYPPPPAGAPVPPAAPAMPAMPGAPAGFTGGAPMLALGDISIVGDQIITPSGSLPLKGAVWNATDFSRTEEKIPTHAIILAIVFFLFCLLGLLFLLMKQKTTTGFVQVTVTSGGRHHSTMVPATDPGTFPWVMSQLNYARSLSV